MAELANRAAVEASFQSAFQDLQDNQAVELKGLLGNPPNPANVPQSYWQKNRREIEILLLLFLMGTYTTSATQHGGRAKDDSWAKARAAEVAAAHVENTREAVVKAFAKRAEAEAAARARSESPSSTPSPVEPPSGEIEKAFGEKRAERVVASETTAATSAGGDRGIADVGGVSPDDRWRTERDARVCPVCSPLEGARRERWSRFFPNGPGAHPGCRCWIEYANGPEPGGEPQAPKDDPKPPVKPAPKPPAKQKPAPEAPAAPIEPPEPPAVEVPMNVINIPFWSREGENRFGMRKESRDWWKKKLKTATEDELTVEINHVEGDAVPWTLVDGRHRFEAQVDIGKATRVPAKIIYHDKDFFEIRREKGYITVDPEKFKPIAETKDWD